MLDHALEHVGRRGGDMISQQTTNPLLPLKTHGLSLSIDGKCLIDNIDLVLTTASLTVVMGQNGAGKSLLLKLLHGLLTPTKGEIIWAGRPMSDDVRLDQAMVFQRPVLLRRSVAANLDFVLGLRDGVDIGMRDRLLDEVGLLDKAKQPARLLSGGEQQRLALIRALALQPKTLFLDEPTASLDPASVVMIEGIVRAAHKRGVKVIFVTHDIVQARRLADDVLFLHDGRIEAQLDANAFFQDPKSDVASAFLEGRIVL